MEMQMVTRDACKHDILPAAHPGTWACRGRRTRWPPGRAPASCAVMRVGRGFVWVSRGRERICSGQSRLSGADCPWRCCGGGWVPRTAAAHCCCCCCHWGGEGRSRTRGGGAALGRRPAPLPHAPTATINTHLALHGARGDARLQAGLGDEGCHVAACVCCYKIVCTS